MVLYSVSDWDDAYANGANIANGQRWPDAWLEPARAFREHLGAAGRSALGRIYGPAPRNRFDLFLPQGEPRGLVVFIHGGYWMRFDQSFWSHLAHGPVERGFAVAMPTYTLCPDTRIAGIVAEIGAAIGAIAKEVAGPIYLAGHSAGGHLASRMICSNSPLPEGIRDRIRNVVSISGVHDLRPLMRTSMQATLRLDEPEARSESPALLTPMNGARITCWVGGGERAEFIRQSALLANVWLGLGASTSLVVEPDRHHFNVIDGLAEPSHPLNRTLLEA